ncbi:MAG: HAMP domain-containing protein [Thermomicrobiales bacterium]|nr:HAMP domain-containing protein [Thermomicrobiales bacterium]
MGRRWSLRTRSVAAASLCLLPLLGVVLFILDQSLENSTDQIFETQLAFAEVVARGITQTLTENQEVLTTISADSRIKSMDPALAQEVLAQAKELRPSLTGLFLVDPNKNIVAFAGGVDPAGFAAEIGPAAEIAVTAGETAITDKLTVAGSDVSVIAMLSPVLSEAESSEDSGVPVGAIGSFISVDRVQRSFLPVTGDAESQTSVALISTIGVIADQGSPGNNTSAIMEELDDEIADSVAGKRSSLTYRDSSGHERQGVLIPIDYPGAKWAVAVTGPSPNTYGPNQNLLREGLTALAIAALLTLLLATIFGELTARPIRQLTAQAKAIAAGDLDQPVEVTGKGEVAALSQALGLMSTRLTSEVKNAESAQSDMAMQNDVMRELLRRTVRTQEDERRRIAADIHDAVSPLITGALYRVRALLIRESNGQEHHAEENGEAQDGLTATADLLEQSMDELHNVIFALRPPDLDDVGVVAAIERYVNQINRTGLPCELEVSGDERRLSPETRLSVYRIVQEALHNSLRHARADEALVKMEYLDDELRVSVRDNGSGFDPESAIRSVSLGLLSMQERAAAIGADLDIVSRPGAGTIVVLRRSWQNDLMEPALDEGEEPVEEPVDENGRSEVSAPPTNGALYPAGLPEAQST